MGKLLILRFIFALIIPFINLEVSAQTYKVKLTGKLLLNTGETFPYKLILSETNGVISGYSVTYDEPNETKTTVTGFLDRNRHTLSFRETEIVSSHQVHTRAYMCLIVSNLEYGQTSGIMALSGPVNSMEKDKTECTGGTVVFGNREETDNLFSYHDQFDTVITMKKRAPAPVPVAAPAEIATAPAPEEKITEGIEKTFTWKTDSAVIDVWDGGNVDGDRVTVLFNGRPLLTNYYLVKEKRQLRVRLSGNAVDTVTIVAINEGSDPPNTASLLFTDGPIQYGVLAYNKTGRKAVIKLKKAGR